MTQEEIIMLAKNCGFDEVNVMDPKTIKAETWVRETCRTNKCGAYMSNWGCPDHGETLEDDVALLRSFDHGLILQCIGKSEKRIDRKMYAETGQRLANGLRKLNDEMKKNYPNSIVLGAGGCTFCKECARPDPCRFPDKRIEALEGYGVFITALCKDNNVLYNYGPNTIAYNGALLW